MLNQDGQRSEVFFQPCCGSSAPSCNRSAATEYPLTAKIVVASGVCSAKGPMLLVFKKLNHKVKALVQRKLCWVSSSPYWAGLGTTAGTGSSFWSAEGCEGKCSQLREAVQGRVIIRVSNIRKQASNSVQAVVSGTDSDSHQSLAVWWFLTKEVWGKNSPKGTQFQLLTG